MAAENAAAAARRSRRGRAASMRPRRMAAENGGDGLVVDLARGLQ